MCLQCQDWKDLTPTLHTGYLSQKNTKNRLNAEYINKIIEDIRQAGNDLLKANGLTKSTKGMYDFMKVFDAAGKFTGRYVKRIGSKYYDLYYKIKNILEQIDNNLFLDECINYNFIERFPSLIYF